MLGGRAAEEVVFNDVTTGASNDFDQATQIARSMVIDYGMSELGPINFGPTQDITDWGKTYYGQNTVSESTREKGIIVKAISIEEERNSQKAQEEKERGGRNGRKRIAYEKSRKMTDNDEKKKRQEIRERNQVIQDLAEKLRDRKNWEAHRRDKRREKERYKERAYEEFTKAALPDQDDKSADQYYQDGEETYEETYNDITEAKVAIRQEEIAKNKKHYEKEIEAAGISGDSDKVLFNFKYLHDVVSFLSSEEIVIKLNNPQSPVVIEPLKSGEYLYLVMPIKL
jgi:cell division protease FtsH